MRTAPAVLHLTAPLLLTGDGDLLRRFSGIAYSGGLIPSWNAVVDIASTTLTTPMPLLADHGAQAPIGVIRAATSGAALEVSGELFSDVDATAAAISAKARRGLPWQMSIGLYQAVAEEIPAGQRVTVNGREFAGPVVVLRRGTVREASVVALGADPKTQATFFSAGMAPSHPSPEHLMSTPAGPTPESTAAQAALAARITALESDNKALLARAEAAEKDLAAVRREARIVEVKALFSATGREFSEAAAAPYVALAAEAFKAIAADLAALAKAAPEHLFREQATAPPAANGAHHNPLLADAAQRGWVKS